MKISFTGTGCSGKSTLLTKCKEYYGDRFNYVTEVTRPIARMGHSINEEGDDNTQKAIINAHRQNNKLDNVIMDRCIVDGYVYTTWLYSKDKVTTETHDLAFNTLNEIVNDIDIIFYTYPLEMEDDGERSTDKRFQKDIDNMMTNLLYEDPWFKPYKGNLVILEGDVDKRFNDVKIAIQTHEHSTVG